MPYACEVYPTFRFNLKVVPPEVDSQESSPAELIKAPTSLPSAIDSSNSLTTASNPTGALDHFESFDLTPTIGKEFPKANLAEWLQVPDADKLIRDLAVAVSQRGVVFFRAQNDLTNDLQIILSQRLGEVTKKPMKSSFNISQATKSHSGKEEGNNSTDTDLKTKISAERKTEQHKKHQLLKKAWNSDITYEPMPSGYAILKADDLQSLGGDTLWASGYELYSHFSPPYQTFLDNLTATHASPTTHSSTTSDLSTTHPVTRTNPVTGWKSIFAVGPYVQHIDGLTERESSHLLHEFVRVITENHDLQVRFRWNQNDVAIWDSRSTYHTTTCDFGRNEPRSVQYYVGIGERPYLDPASKSKREAEGLQ